MKTIAIVYRGFSFNPQVAEKDGLIIAKFTIESAPDRIHAAAIGDQHDVPGDFETREAAQKAVENAAHTMIDGLLYDEA